MSSSFIFQIQSTLILGVFFLGILNRKNRDLHPKLMKFGILWDLLLVLQIELTRKAILKASKVVTNSLLLNFHVAIAISTVLLYFVMWYLGSKALKDPAFRSKHKFFGILTMTLRCTVYVTSYLV